MTTLMRARFWMWLDKVTGGDETCDEEVAKGKGFPCTRRYRHVGPHVHLDGEVAMTWRWRE